MDFLPDIVKVAVSEAVVMLLFAVDGGMLVEAELPGIVLHVAIRGTATFVPFLL